MNPIVHLYHEMDRVFENAFRGLGLFSGGSDISTPFHSADIGVTDHEYEVTIEVPGVSESDVKMEIADAVLRVRGEKRQGREERNQNFYRVERSYGSFQRVLGLPEDEDQEKIDASFKKSVLTLKIPRKN